MKTSKTELMHVVQGNYGHGWEDLTQSTDYKEAKANLKDYRDNDPSPTRLIKRRVKLPPTKVRGTTNAESYEIWTLDGLYVTEVTDSEQFQEYLRANNMECINYDELRQE